MQARHVDANGQYFETFTWGSADAPPLLFLHGFPEHALAWEEIATAFADRFFCIAPNQRGYGRSSKPADVDDYRVQHLAKDMLALVEALAPGRRSHVVAHDWGGSVAYMMAFLASQRLATLTVANGVHPLPFQRAIIQDPEQREASQYIRFLRRDDAAALLSADNFRRLLRFVTEGFGGGAWLTDAKRAGYLAAWSEPGALEAMVAWYKATPLLVPLPGETVAADPLAHINPAMVRVRMPHLLLWGVEDKALRPSCHAGLDTYCDELTIRTVAGADHWIIHQRPAEVIAEIEAFLSLHGKATGAG